MRPTFKITGTVLILFAIVFAIYFGFILLGMLS